MSGGPGTEQQQDQDPAAGGQADTGRLLAHRNADIYAAAAASRREEFARESSEIGSDTLPDDDPQRDPSEPDADPDGRSAEVGGAAAGPDDAASTSDDPTDDETVEVKVDGETLRVLKTEVDEAGGVAAYQKDVAAARRLTKAAERQGELDAREARLRAQARAMGIDYDTGQPISTNTPPAQRGGAGADNGAGPRPASGTADGADDATDDELDAALEEHSNKVSLAADPAEVKAAGKKLIEAVVKKFGGGVDEATVLRIVAAREEKRSAQREWNETLAKHTDVINDPEGWELVRALVRRGQIEDLVKQGADRNACMNLSDQQLGGYHLVARQNGTGRKLSDLVEAAVTHTRKRLGITAASPSDAGAANAAQPTGQGRPTGATPQPTADALARRQALKGGAAVATSTPASSSAAPSNRPQFESGNTASDYINWMRRKSGRPPLGPQP